MTVFKHASSAVCAAALLAGTAASADVTAQQVWDDWKTNFSMYGEDAMTIGSEDASGGTVTVTDLAFTVEGTDSTVVATISSLVFTENGDGTVSIEMAPEYPISISSTDSEGVAVETEMALRQSGMAITASGSPEEMTYDVTADRYALELDSVTENGQPMDAEMVIALNDLTGSYTTTAADLRSIDYTADAGSLDLLIDITDPGDGTAESAPMAVTLSGKIENLSSEATVEMPSDMNPEDPAAMFAGGFMIDGGYEFGAMSYLFDVSEAGQQTTGTATAGSGALDVSIGAEAVSYESSLVDVAVNFAGGAIPFPVDVTLGEYGVSLLMPMSKTDAPTDFRLGITLSELGVNDMIWSMLDPGGVLPHDPATVIVDVSGTGTLNYDLTDPAQAEAMAMAPVPGELNSLSLDTLEVEIAGAAVSGTGAFTFDNSDMTTFPGMPRPQGEANFEIVGANALLDKLVQMGLVPQDQVMGFRMMLGLFATPVGDDQLTSKIEVNAEGQVFANGQRIQ